MCSLHAAVRSRARCARRHVPARYRQPPTLSVGQCSTLFDGRCGKRPDAGRCVLADRRLRARAYSVRPVRARRARRARQKSCVRTRHVPHGVLRTMSHTYRGRRWPRRRRDLEALEQKRGRGRRDVLKLSMSSAAVVRRPTDRPISTPNFCAPQTAAVCVAHP